MSPPVRNLILAILTALILGSLMTLSTAAHHSLSTVYDSRRPVTLTGSVREFQFVNPHPWIGIDVASQNGGGAQRWRLELDNRWELENIGMHAETFKSGDLVVASGSGGRDGARAVYVRRLERAADGLLYEQVGPSPRVTYGAARGATR